MRFFFCVCARNKNKFISWCVIQAGVGERIVWAEKKSFYNLIIPVVYAKICFLSKKWFTLGTKGTLIVSKDVVYNVCKSVKTGRRFLFILIGSVNRRGIKDLFPESFIKAGRNRNKIIFWEMCWWWVSVIS